MAKAKQKTKSTTKAPSSESWLLAAQRKKDAADERDLTEKLRGA